MSDSKYEKKDNAGVLFFERDKKSGNHPDMKGTALIDGQEYWVSAWAKTSKAGNKFISLSVKKKDGSNQAPRAEQKKDTGWGAAELASDPAFNNDSLPF